MLAEGADGFVQGVTGGGLEADAFEVALADGVVQGFVPDAKDAHEFRFWDEAVGAKGDELAEFAGECFAKGGEVCKGGRGLWCASKRG